MTKKEAVARFRQMFPTGSFTGVNGQLDRPARAEAWNNYTDALCKDGEITLRQYETWSHPWR